MESWLSDSRLAGRNIERVRELVLEWGWNATSYQILNPGISHWFSQSGHAVVGYVRSRACLVVAGAPVAPPDELEAVAAEFEMAAVRCGLTVCYFGAERRLEELYRNSPTHSMVLLGAQPVWNPGEWHRIVGGRASLRAQIARARNKGVVVEEWRPEQATGHPELRRCLAEWLHSRPLPPLHFLVEPSTLGHLDDRRIIVARRGAKIIGFLVASPVPCRSGWLIEQIIRGHNSVNGTTEIMIDAAMRRFADEHADYITLGLSPLSRRSGLGDHGNPHWMRAILGWVRAHGRRFYNFDGLDAFKAKFDPLGWNPIYAIAAQHRFTPTMLYSIAGAFAGGTPGMAVMHGLLRAFRSETVRLRRLVFGSRVRVNLAGKNELRGSIQKNRHGK